jgi:hypothetical protein
VPAAVALPADDVEGAYAASAFERDLGRLLSARHETKSFIIQHRPGGAAEQGRAAIEEKLAAAWQKVCARLDLKTPRKLQVFLYDSAAEMGRLTGRPSDEAMALGESLHVPADRPVLGAALAKVAEPQWGRIGEKLGGGLQGGRWYRVKISARGGHLDVRVDERKLAEGKIPVMSPGAIALGVEEGRFAIRELRVRAAPADPDAQINTPWSFPLRGAPATALAGDSPGRWRVGDDEAEGIRYGRMSRARLEGTSLKDLELECELRISEGSTAEIALGVTDKGSSARIVFGAGSTYVATSEGRRPLTGPHPTLREGLAAALAAEIDGIPVEPLARALLDRELAPPRELLRLGLPSGGTERYRRQVLLGAFVVYSLQKYGPAKYRELHFDDLFSPKTPIGEVGAIEAAWRKYIKEKTFGADDLARAARKLGLDVLADGKKWRDLTPALQQGRFKTEGPGKFEAGDDGVEWHAVAGTQASARLNVPELASGAKTALRASVRLGESTRVRLTLRTRDGRTSAALLSPSGGQIVTPDNTVAAKSAQPLEPGRFYDAVLVLENGAGRLYIDGELVAETKSGLAAGPGKLTIDFEGRDAEVRAVALRNIE